jgi:general nucleoside transport system permease protein
VTGLGAFLAATVRTATPLALAALGELVTETSGIINISLEGSIIAGAFGGFVGATIAGVPSGYVFGIGAGMLVGMCFAAFAVMLGADAIVTGTALTMAAMGVTGTLYRVLYAGGGALPVIRTSTSVVIPGVSSLPWVGAAFFQQPWVTYAAYLLAPAIWWFLYRTHAGLAIRAAGAAPQAAAVRGIRVDRLRISAVLFGSALGGLAGATLVLAQAGTFAEGMSAGRGFIAIAIVALGRWNPLGVLGAALVFGAAMAVQFVVQALGWNLRYELVLMIPYLLTLVALVLASRRGASFWFGRSRAPSR